MKQKSILKFTLGTACNAMLGFFMFALLGLPSLIGAAAMAAVPMVFGDVMPSGVLGAGVATEIWTGEMVKTLRNSDEAPWLDGVPDFSKYAEKDVIHMVDIGADPEVLVNNTTYPIDIQELADGDIAFKLDKFQTKATSVTDDELYAISYDKIASVKDRHAAAIKESKYAKAIHAFAPQSSTVNTPVLQTTGEFADGTSGRRRLCRKDVVRLKAAFDDQKIPTQGRRLVLCSDHVNDLLMIDQKFETQYYNYTSGKIANLYGFEVYEYSANPHYKVDGSKVAFGAAVGETDTQASVAFYRDRMCKASGSTKMYYKEADPQNQRSLVKYLHDFTALPKTQEGMGAIVSAYVADSEE